MLECILWRYIFRKCDEILYPKRMELFQYYSKISFTSLCEGSIHFPAPFVQGSNKNDASVYELGYWSLFPSPTSFLSIHSNHEAGTYVPAWSRCDEMGRSHIKWNDLINTFPSIQLCFAYSKHHLEIFSRSGWCKQIHESASDVLCPSVVSSSNGTLLNTNCLPQSEQFIWWRLSSLITRA